MPLWGELQSLRIRKANTLSIVNFFVNEELVTMPHQLKYIKTKVDQLVKFQGKKHNN